MLLLPQAARAVSAGPPAHTAALVHDGVSVEFSAAPLAVAPERAQELREGQEVEVRLRIRDEATGNPMSGLRPAAWLDLRHSGERPDEAGCQRLVQSFLGSSLSARPLVDLNMYYVLALNDDASISVVDPLFGYGGSKLITTVQLDGPGRDWALSRDRKRLYVSVPSAGHVALVDTATWKVAARLPAGARPGRLALQPDGRYLWVGDEGDAGGVTVIDTSGPRVAARIATAPGRHEFSFTADDSFAFVLSAGPAGGLSVVDIRVLRKVRDLVTGQGPTDLAYSELADAVYVAHGGDGSIAVVDARRHEVVARIPSKPGLERIRFVPGGRWAIAANATEGAALVVDASLNRIVQVAAIPADPKQIAFSATSIYLRPSHSESVAILPQGKLGKEELLPVSEFPGGRSAPAEAGADALADTIVAAPEGNAVLVANAADRTIYYYEEGMAAPMGSFKNYGRKPLAALVVDRGLRESAPGLYTTSLKLPAGGRYDVALLLDSPRIVQCFDLAVSADPQLHRDDPPELRIQPLSPRRELLVGSEYRLAFRVMDAASGAGLRDLEGIGALVVLAPGLRQEHVPARAREDGVYELAIRATEAGAYYVHVQCPSLGAGCSRLPPLILRAGLAPPTEESEAATEEASNR